MTLSLDIATKLAHGRDVPPDEAQDRNSRAVATTPKMHPLQHEARSALGIVRRLGRRLRYQLREMEKQDKAAGQEVGWSGLPGDEFIEQFDVYHRALMALATEQRKRAEMKQKDESTDDDLPDLLSAFDALNDEEFSLLMQRRASLAKDGNAQ